MRCKKAACTLPVTIGCGFCKVKKRPTSDQHAQTGGSVIFRIAPANDFAKNIDRGAELST
jgi:hypothetical protein